MAVSSTTFFIVNCAIIGSPRSEYSSISRYWTKATRPASMPIIPSSRALSQASGMGHRLQSRAMRPTRARMIDHVDAGRASGRHSPRTARLQKIAIAQDQDVDHRQLAQPRPHDRSGGSEIVCRAGLRRDRRLGVKPPVSSADAAPAAVDRPGLVAGADSGAGGPARRPIRRRARRLGGRQEPVPVRPLVLGQEAADLGPQVVVPAAGGAEPGLPPGGVDPDRGIEQLADLSPALRRHPSPPPSWPASQARASRQSRSTVTTETPSAAATSGDGHPAEVPQGHDLAPGARSSSASRSRASWTATTSSPCPSK